MSEKGCHFVILGAILMGTLPIFVKKINLNPLELSFYRLFLGFVFLLIFLLLFMKSIKSNSFMNFKRENYKIIILITLINTATIVSYISSIKLIKVAMAALLLYMAPVYVVPLSKILGEDISLLSFASLPIGIIGLLLMLSPKNFGLGDIFGITSGIFYAIYFILMKKARKEMSSLQITFAYLALSSILLLPAGIESFKIILNFSLSEFLLILGLGLIPTALAFTIFNHGIKSCGAGKSSLSALVEPVSAGIFGFIFFGEVLTLKQVFGAFLILLAILLSLI